MTESPHLTPRPPDHDHLRWIDDLLGAVNWRSSSVWDLGCGSGFVCEELSRRGCSSVIGIDWQQPPEMGVSRSEWTFLQRNLNDDWTCDLEQPVDYVLAFDILEHLDAPWRFLQQIVSSLRPGGHLILTTPNVGSWERRVRPKDWSGVTDPEHKILFDRYSLQFTLERAGYSLASMHAPIRSLGLMGLMLPQWGGQLIAHAVKIQT